MKRIKKVAPFLIVLTLFVGFILVTDPYKLPLALLVVPFLLLSVMVYQGSRFILMHTPLSRYKSRWIAGIVTALVVLIALLQSINQLSGKDFLILTALMIGLVFYLRRFDF